MRMVVNVKLLHVFSLIALKTSHLVVFGAESEEDCSKEADKCTCEYHQAILPAVNGIGGLNVCEVFNLMISCIELEPSSLSQEARYDRLGHIKKEQEELGFHCNTCNLQECHQTYLRDIAEPLNHRERLQTCRVYGQLQWCVDQLECGLGGEAKEKILETVYWELNRRGLRCVEDDKSAKQEDLAKQHSNTELVSSKQDSCSEFISVCSNAYVHQVHKSTTKEHSRRTKDREDTFCPIFQSYSSCLKSTTCQSKSQEVEDIIKTEHIELQNRGIRCGNGALEMPDKNGGVKPRIKHLLVAFLFGFACNAFKN